MHYQTTPPPPFPRGANLSAGMFSQQKVRTTTEAVAIVLVGVGALFTIMAPKLLRARNELEGKALVGPSAVASSSSCENLCGGNHQGVPGDTTSGASVLSCRHSSDDQRQRPISQSGSVVDGVFGTAAEVCTSDIFPDTDGSPPPVLGAMTSKGSGGGGGIAALSRPHTVDGRSAVGSSAAARYGGYGDRPATTGRDRGLVGSIVPDPSGFWTPPKRTRVRRSRSSVEGSTRTADGMAMAAAAAGGNGQRLNQSGRGGKGKGGEGGGRGRGGGGGGGSSSRGERSASTASLSGLSGERRGSGSGHNRSYSGYTAKPPLSEASGSSRASRASSRGRTSSRSNKASTRHGSSGGSGGGASAIESVRSNRDSWVLDPLMLAINGYGWSGSLAAANIKQGAVVQGSRKSGGGAASDRRSGGGGGGRRPSGRWSGSGSVKRGTSRERLSSVGSSSARGRRSENAAGSLVMYADTGTRLHCPHCDKEVRKKEEGLSIAIALEGVQCSAMIGQQGNKGERT